MLRKMKRKMIIRMKVGKAIGINNVLGSYQERGEEKGPDDWVERVICTLPIVR